MNINIDGIQIYNAKKKDKDVYYQVKKECCEKFVKKYFGGWNENEQRDYNNKIFDESLSQTCFKMIKFKDKPVGFFGYSVFEKEVGCVTLQIMNIKSRSKIFIGLLQSLICIATKLNKPIYAKSFLGSKDVEIYKDAGFEVVGTTQSHYLLSFKEKSMERINYESLVNERFNGETKELMLKQIANFYDLGEKEFKNKKYKLGADVVLGKTTLMTGFKFDAEYLKLIAKEGKICGDYAGVETRHGVKWAVSTWKFAKKIKLKDYVTKYSGMTVAYNGVYEIVPYGKLDEFVEKLKKKDHFLWEAESTREMRFLPNDIRKNGSIALIFNVGHKDCDKLLENELQRDFIPEEIALRPNPNERNKTRALMEKGFGERCAYIMFGIPRNCIEGLFVDRTVEKNKKQLTLLKQLFPDCYICNIDGKVIAE